MVAGCQGEALGGVKSRVLRPRSRISPLVPSRTGMMSASQASLRKVVAATGPVNVKLPAPVPVPVPVPVPLPASVAVPLAAARWWGRRSW